MIMHAFSQMSNDVHVGFRLQMYTQGHDRLDDPEGHIPQLVQAYYEGNGDVNNASNLS